MTIQQDVGNVQLGKVISQDDLIVIPPFSPFCDNFPIPKGDLVLKLYCLAAGSNF